MNTIDEILTFLEKAAEQKIPLPPHRWVDAALSLNALIGNLHDDFSLKEQDLAKMRVSLADTTDLTSAKINDRVEATDTYREMRRLKFKIAQIEEFIRLAKTQARLKDNEFSAY